MSKHKIVVTRDTTKIADICIWKSKTKLVFSDKVWDYGKGATSDNLIKEGFNKVDFKIYFGFLPRKGSKEIVEIIRKKK